MYYSKRENCVFCDSTKLEPYFQRQLLHQPKRKMRQTHYFFN